MAVTRIGASSTASGSSVSLPSHQAGDLLIAVAFNRDSNALPSRPAASGSVPSWNVLKVRQVTTACAGGVYWATATSSSHTSGTWGNTNLFGVLVYRGASVIAGGGINSSQFSSSVSYPSLSLLPSGLGVDLAFRVGFHEVATDVNLAGFSGWSLSTAPVGSSSTGEFAVYTTTPSTSSISSASDSVNASGPYIAFTFYAQSYERSPLEADRGQFSATAAPATLLFGYPPFATGAAEFQVSGGNAGLGLQRTTPFDGDSFSVTGGDVSFSIAIYTAPLNARRARFQAEGQSANLFYITRFEADTGHFALTGTSLSFPRGYYVNLQGGSTAATGGDASFKRALIARTGPSTYSTTLISADPWRGYSFLAGPISIGTAFSDSTYRLAARLICSGASFDVDVSSVTLLRDLKTLLDRGAFTLSGYGLGTRLTPGISPTGQPTHPPVSPYGGSDRTGGLSISSQYVQFGSHQRAKDFGIVSNLTAQVVGLIGSQTGTNTIFLRAETDGPAQVRIISATTNRFTSKFVSVGLLDENRKSIPTDAFGFGYQNDNIATDPIEAFLPLPKGVYFFTISTSQWAAIPYDVTIQIFRFKEISGGITGTLAPYGRFDIAKMSAAALLTMPAAGQIIPRTALHLLSAKAGGASTASLTLTIMRGAAGGTMQPYGRLKQTHRITGATALTNSSVATLTSTPPYGGGGGGGY